MSTGRINSLIMQNRLLSQARSRARTQSAQIGSILQNSSNNGKNALLNAIKNDADSQNNGGLSEADAASKENYTAMKKAAESIKTHTKNLLLWPDKEWDEMTEEETAKYKDDAVREFTGLITDYNAMVKNMSNEHSQVNEIYLKQLGSYFKNAKTGLEALGITRGEDGMLSLNQELLKAADARTIKKVLGSEGSFTDDIGKRADNIIANAETNLAVINKSQYAGNYTYNQFGSDVFDALTSGSKYSAKS